MVKALAYTAQLLGVLSAVLVWVLFIPIVDLLTPGTDQGEAIPHDLLVDSFLFLDAA
jgi:hypothetical protein